MNTIDAKVSMVNRYLNLLLRDRGVVNPRDIFRAVSPEMRKHVDIAVFDAENAGEEIEFVKVRENVNA